MATQMTPEEIQDIFDEYNRAVANGASVSRELTERLRDASVGVKNYSANLKASLGQLGQSSRQLASDLASGAKGASVFNDSLDAAAGAASSVAAGFGPLGIVIGLAVKAFSFFVGQVNKQSDALYNSFQDISRSGAIGAQSMDQVFESMIKMGYTLDELSSMGAMFQDTSRNFGLFSSSVLAGTKQMVEVADTIQNSDLRRQLFNMGLSVDGINRGIAGYINQQGRLGKLEQMTQSQISQGAVAYIKEMEILTRLTGQQREELEAQREAAMNIDAFYAAVSDMPEDAQKQVMATFNALSKQNPKLAEEYAANFAGILTGQTDLFLATGGAYMQFNKEFYLAGGQMKDAMAGIQEGLRQNLDTIKGVAQVGGEFGVTFKDANQLINKDFTKGIQEATQSVIDQEKGLNAATNSQSAIRDSQIKTAQAAQDLVNLGVNPLTKAMQKLTEVIERLADLLPGAIKSNAKPEAQSSTNVSAANIDSTLKSIASNNAAGTGSSTPFAGSQKEFYDQMYGMLLEHAKKAGVQNPDVIARLGTAQSALESGYGKHLAGGNNYFGIKAKPGDKNASVVETQDWDQQLGFFTHKQPFRRYGNMSESAADYIKFLQENKRYKEVLAAKTIEEAILAQGKTGYAGDPAGYVQKLQSINARALAGPSGASGFRGILSGPMSGYNPNLQMHGTEEISIRPMGGSINNAAGASESTMLRLIDKVEDLIQVSRSQLTVNEKLLKYAQ